MAAAIPGAHLVVIDDAAALLAAEVPDTISTLIEKHVNSAEAHHG
jgi:3-oxoadipate enol-lactonase